MGKNLFPHIVVQKIVGVETFLNLKTYIYIQLKCAFQGGIEFATSGRPVFTDTKYFRDYGWYISGSMPTVQIVQDSQVPQVLIDIYNFFKI